MTNIDIQEVCFSGIANDCSITPPDIATIRERVHKLPAGYTKTLVNSLKDAFPDKFQNEEDAYMVFDALKAVIARGIQNGDSVDLEGLGVFKREKEGGKSKVAFYPQDALTDID